MNSLPRRHVPAAATVMGLGVFSGTAPLAAQADGPQSDGGGGYLFACMLDVPEYGRLYYATSRDGSSWKLLNNGQRIIDDWYGHPDLSRTPEGDFQLIAVVDSETMGIWRSPDLIHWSRDILFPQAALGTSHHGFETDNVAAGAPKIVFDADLGRYLITWHASPGGKDERELWEGMRTFYTLTDDFVHFDRPERLFDFSGEDADMATIDTIVRKVGDVYYAIIKDERWPESSPHGKTIRVATSRHLTSGYTNPGEPITPAWREAPTIVPSVDGRGWILFAENYDDGTGYNRYTSSDLEGPWSAEVNLGVKFRHGCAVRVDERTLCAIERHFR